MEEVGTWRKASYSATNGNCVEVADATGTVLVRDTTDRTSAMLTVTAEAWQRFTATIKLAETATLAGTGARLDRARRRPCDLDFRF
jgi:predicted secreted Zn-dependent protease